MEQKSRQQLVIKAGYRITATTWENDGDFCKTMSMDGLDENEARAATAILDMMVSDSEFANMYEPSDHELDLADEAWIEAIKPFYKDKSPEDLQAIVYDIHQKLGLDGEGYYTRVVEYYEVHFFPENVYADLITDAFKRD